MTNVAMVALRRLILSSRHNVFFINDAVGAGRFKRRGTDVTGFP